MPELGQEPFKPKFSPDELRRLERALFYLAKGVRQDLDRISAQYEAFSVILDRVTELRRYLKPFVAHLDNPPHDAP